MGIALASSSRWIFLAGVAIAGMGYGAVNPATNVLSTALVPRHHRALFLSIKQMGVTLGGLIAGLALPRLGQALGWRPAVAVAVGLLLCGALAGRWITRREATGWFRAARRPTAFAQPGASVSVPGARATALFGFVMSGVQLSLAGYLTLYLVDAHGFSKTTAGVALSVAFASACVGRIVWGWCSDRFFRSHATTLVVISGASLVGLAAMASGVVGPTLWLIVGIIGLCSIGWNGVYMALITDSASHGGLGRATGRGLTAIYGGVAVVPPVLGAVKDLSHSWSAVWAVSIGAVLLAGAVLALSPRKLVRVESDETALLDAPCANAV
jgi:MFS family permease